MVENLINFYIPIIVGFYLFFKNPIYLAALLPAFQFIRFGISIGFTIIYAIDFLNLLMLVFIFSKLGKNRFKLPLEFGGKMIFFFTSLFFLKIIIGQNNDTPRVLFDYVFLFVSLIFYLNVIDKKNWLRALKYFAFSKLILVFYSLIFMAFPSYFPQAYTVTFGITESNFFFRFALLQQASYLFIFCLIFLTGKKKYLGLFITLFLVVLSGSRTHLLICLIIASYYFSISFFLQKRFYLFFQSIIIFLIVSIGIQFILENPRFYKISYRFNTLMEDPTKAGGARMEYYENSLEMTRENILFGNKIYNSKEIAGKYSNDWMPVLTGRTHNVYLAILYAFGILGLIPIILMLSTYIKFTYRAFSFKNQNHLMFLHLILIASIIEGFTAGVYYSYVADVLIICLIMFVRYNELKPIKYSLVYSTINNKYVSKAV